MNERPPQWHTVDVRALVAVVVTAAILVVVLALAECVRDHRAALRGAAAGKPSSFVSKGLRQLSEGSPMVASPE